MDKVETQIISRDQDTEWTVMEGFVIRSWPGFNQVASSFYSLVARSN
mgnify:CR=1 FL=1